VTVTVRPKKDTGVSAAMWHQSTDSDGRKQCSYARQLGDAVMRVSTAFAAEN
jgi:hypothetical protein